MVEQTHTNDRSRLAAALLALFLGGLGAHWYYLGDSKAGTFYLVAFLVSLALSLVAIGLLGLAIVGLFALFDFINLLAMSPADFDARYNSSAPSP